MNAAPWLVLLFVGCACAVPWLRSFELPPDNTDALFEGDIRLTEDNKHNVDLSDSGDVDGERLEAKRNAVRNRALLWTDRIVPYVIDATAEPDTAAIIAAIQEFTSKTCIVWRPRQGNEYYVKFVREVGCWSYVGRINAGDGFQKLCLGEGCSAQQGVVLHEMMHALGFWHAQSRPDRNQVVEVMWENITPGKEHNFNKYSHFDADILDLPYDINSVMHYGNKYFSANGKNTLQKIGDPTATLGQRTGFSVNDLLQLNKLYSCSNASGGWSEWSNYSPCDSANQKSRMRFCMNTNKAACNALITTGVQTATIACSAEEINEAVDGHWGRWSAWSACSKSCGDGTQARTRLCDDPAPKNNGKNCAGDSTQSQACKNATCGLGPDDCEFDTDFCHWEQDASDTAETYKDWLRSGAGTPSGYTGPSSPRQGAGHGCYAYAEASACAVGHTVRMKSKEFPAAPNGRCMKFYYYAYGLTYGSWRIYVRTSSGMTKIYEKIGSQGEQWISDQVTITSTVNYRVVFELTCGSNYASDLCIDDVMFTEVKCPA